MTAAELRRRRCGGAAARERRSPARSAPRAVAHLLAVQAQDLRAARLALRARGAARTAAEVDAALTDERSLVSRLADARHAASRRARRLRMAARADGAAERGDEPPPARAARRRRAGGRAGDRARARRRGPAPARRARRAARGGGDPARRARSCRTCSRSPPRRGASSSARCATATQRFALARDWLGPPRGAAGSRDRAGGARAALPARPWPGHATPTSRPGPGCRCATPARGSARSPGELAQDGELVDLARRAAPPPRLPPRLLGAFDPYLLGWRDRAFAVAPEHARRVHPGGGIVRATAVANGRVVGDVGAAARRGRDRAVRAAAGAGRRGAAARGG